MEENKQSSEVPIIEDYEQKKVQENLEHVQDPNQNQQKQSSLEHLDQNKQSNSICGGGNMPRINDKIRYRLPGKDWTVAVVKGRGGKATGKNKNYFNICNMDNGEKLGIHLDKAEFHVVNDDLSVQNDCIDNGNSNNKEVHAVYVPVERHSEFEVLDAKQKELENWSNFNVYSEVDDVGQRTISTRWVVSEKVMPDGQKCVKARLVIRGFEEEDKGPVDSPTASKCSMRIFFAVSANNKWNCETIDIKAAFLQGKNIERDIYIKPPKEIKKDGIIWKLNKVAYGLCDASWQ